MRSYAAEDMLLITEHIKLRLKLLRFELTNEQPRENRLKLLARMAELEMIERKFL